MPPNFAYWTRSPEYRSHLPVDDFIFDELPLELRLFRLSSVSAQQGQLQQGSHKVLRLPTSATLDLPRRIGHHLLPYRSRTGHLGLVENQK